VELPELKLRSEEFRKEATNLAALLSSCTLDETYRDIINLSLRQKLVQQIDEVKINLERQVELQENEIRAYPNLNEGKEVWISMFSAGSEVGYDACLMKKESASALVAQMKTMGTPHTTPTEFAEFVTKLKHDIIDGKFDDKLTSKAANLIYETLK